MTSLASHTMDPPRDAGLRLPWLVLALALASLLALAWGASVGSTGFDSLLRVREDPAAWQIVWDIRLPRTLGAWLAGALLALAGAVAQGLFRNPLADPFLLGSASGAALGVALAYAALGVGGMVAGGGSVALLQAATPWLARLGFTGAAFLGALAGVLLALVLARGVQQTLRLLLAGVVVGFVLGAVRDLVQLAQPDVLQAMQGFTLGVTGFVGWGGCALMAAVLAPLLLLAWALARVLDALSLGEATALSLGLPLAPLRALLVGVLALATGAAVAQTGLIGFVGLVAPHLARSMVRCTHAALLLLSTLVGGLLLMLADVASRLLVAPQELPVGVLTAVLGGAYLLWLMNRRAGVRGVQ
ncbi:FecCD family ABC transporter permease [Comamonas sp. NLF-1-9]|uniref:FecCD family ABC transporter permease n=1 Tax=Comamonas sp. NLF-1-9 TaxID=2853163 RepID=UPI00351CD304